MNTVSFSHQAPKPRIKPIEEVVSKNSHKLKLELAYPDDPAIKKLPLKLLNYKGVIGDAFFYKRVFPTIQKEEIYLVGLLVEDNQLKTKDWLSTC